MSDFVNSILDIIFLFKWNDVTAFFLQIGIKEVLTETTYILFNMTFWLVLGVFFNFIYRTLKFVYHLLFS